MIAAGSAGRALLAPSVVKAHWVSYEGAGSVVDSAGMMLPMMFDVHPYSTQELFPVIVPCDRAKGTNL